MLTDDDIIKLSAILVIKDDLHRAVDNIITKDELNTLTEKTGTKLPF